MIGQSLSFRSACCASGLLVRHPGSCSRGPGPDIVLPGEVPDVPASLDRVASTRDPGGPLDGRGGADACDDGRSHRCRLRPVARSSPGVTVTATNTETNQLRSVVTDAAGRFMIRHCPGVYTLPAELSGFSPQSPGERRSAARHASRAGVHPAARCRAADQVVVAPPPEIVAARRRSPASSRSSKSTTCRSTAATSSRSR